MQLNRIIIENYGLYSGRHEFDLTPCQGGHRRSIILFGGKNGAGKTTLLDAIRLAFYGPSSITAKCSRQQYREALTARIHRQLDSDARCSKAMVGVSFDFVSGGTKNSYYVERSWESKNSHPLSEFLTILRDGQEMADIGEKHRQAFLSSIVPERLSQLFFFDGERIRAIAEDISGYEAISEAIEGLLGIDLIDQLSADLSIYTSRMAQDTKHMDAEKLPQLQADLERFKLSISEIEDEKLPEIESRISGLKRDVVNKEAELSRQGASFAAERDANVKRANILEHSIVEAEKAIRSLCEDVLPFALCPEMATKTISMILREQRANVASTAISEFDSLLTELQANLSENGHLTDANIQRVREIVAQVINRKIETYRNELGPSTLQLSKDESRSVIDVLNRESANASEEARKWTAILESNATELQAARRELSQAPESDSLQPLFEELRRLTTQLANAEQEKEALKKERHSLQIQLDGVCREKEKLEVVLSQETKHRGKIRLVKQIHPLLKEYKRMLTEHKIATLQSSVTECYNRLSRKRDFVRTITIDPKSFQVHVHDKHGNMLPKEELSSGEKQIFAIAMLWGLARTSGRSLPVIIDTPLGRLDSDHRLNLIKNYFPHAGHQVVMLSTDTEVDRGLFKKLKPHIARSYHLEYRDEEAATQSSLGYFWDEDGND
jgi:DNA sulfur modification protein DndD